MTTPTRTRSTHAPAEVPRVTKRFVWDREALSALVIVVQTIVILGLVALLVWP